MKKLSKFFLFIFLVLILVTPLQSGAQFIAGDETGGTTNMGTTCNSGLTGILCKLNDLFGAIIPFLVSLGVVYFVWGMVQYFVADSEEAKKTGKNRILYGIIGLAVIVSIWGLVNIVVETFGLGENNTAVDVSSLIVAPASDDCTMGPKFQNLLNYGTCIIGKSVIPFIFAIAMVMFTWGAVKFFIIEASEEAKRAQGKQFMIWGIIALAVMVSVWGLVNILGATFNIDTKFIPEVKKSQ